MDEMIHEYSSEELRHHGIKGMKWGLRRYQNKDGSLTPAGRKRYDKEIESLKSEKAQLQQKHKNMNAQQRMQARKDKLKADIAAEKEYLKNSGKKSGKNDSSDKSSEDTKDAEKPKTAREMSSEELNEAINHMRLQQTYNELYSQLNPEKESKIKKIGKKFLDDAILPAGTSVAKDWLTKVGKEALGINTKEAKSEYDKLKEQYNILKTKKDIEDLKNPKKDYGKENSELRDQLENQKLKDKEYQDLKTRSEKAKMQNIINGAEKTKNNSDNVNNNSNNSGSSSTTDSQKKTGEDYAKKSSYSLMPYESTKNSSDYKSNVDSGSVWVVDKYGEVEIKNGYKED